MKDINNIEDWYRDELANYDVTPDDNGWQSLADDLDANAPLTEDNVSEWYQKEAAKLEERPDYTVWEKLSTKLDTASVWDKLAVSLTRYEQFVWWRNMVIRGTAIFLLFFGSYLAYDKLASTSNNKELAQNNVAEKSNLNNNKKELNGAAPKLSAFQNVTNNNKSEASFVNVGSENARKGKKVKAKSAKRKALFASVKKNKKTNPSREFNEMGKIKKLNHPTINGLLADNSRDIDRSYFGSNLSGNVIASSYEHKEFLVKKEKNKIVFNNKRFSSHFAFGLYARRFYLGANVGFKKQGMITTLNKNSAMGDVSQNYFLDFGTTAGGTFGWIVSDKLNVETNINFSSTGGYKRAYSSESTSFKEELNLNYTTVSLLAKKMNNKSTFDNKKYSTNLIGGIYAGYLYAATSKIDGNSYSNNDYKKMDLGIVLGIEQDRYITKTLVITPGIRFQQGVLDVSKHTGIYSSSRNFSLSFNLGIKYIFLKKG